MVNVAIAQFAPSSDKSANLLKISSLAEEAASNRAKLLVLPEFSMFTVPELDMRFVDAAEDLGGDFVAALQHLSSIHDLYIVAGIGESIVGEDRIFNTLVAIEPNNGIVAKYRKIHLYDAFGVRESSIVKHGTIESPELFRIDGVEFGMQTCYDIRFPEMTRRIADAGADVLILSAEWVPGPLKEDQWATLVRARAIENTIYVAAANQSAPTGTGVSMIVDPMGVVVASLGEREGVMTAAVDSRRVIEVRAKNPALSLRRFGVTARQVAAS